MRVPKTFLVVAALAFVGLVAAAAIVPASGIVPAADQPLFSNGVHVPHQRVGDALRYERTWLDDEEALPSDVLVTVGAPSTAIDAFGIAREVDTTTIAIRGDEDDADYRCSFLRGTAQNVRRDLTAGTHIVMMSGHWQSIPFTDQYTRTSTQTLNLTSSFGMPCAGRHTLGGTTLRAGDELTLTEALGGAATIPGSDALRAKAEATEWEGRKAVRFVFNDGETRVVAIWADGIPGVARVESRGGELRTERTWIFTKDDDAAAITLRGVERGTGEELFPGGGALPVRHPAASFVPAPALLVDDGPFAPAYPFEEAIAGLRTDPVTCARDVLARPDAVITRAEWDADARDYVAWDAPAIGGWSIDMVAGPDACSVFTIRLAPHAMLPTITRNYDEQGPVPVLGTSEGSPEMPAEIADPATIARLVADGGMEANGARNVIWTLVKRGGEPTIHIRASEVSTDPRNERSSESAAVDVLATAGALESLMRATTEVEASPLPLGNVAAAMPEIERSALGGVGGPAVGQGIAAAGIVGVLLLALKFVFLPLYSRLRRATLLDNPVRARLYDAVRRDPGVHRAALIEFAGVGVGATTRHLRQLVAHRYLVETREGAFARYYAAGEVPPAVAREEAVLRAGSRRAVYELYRAEPSLTLREAGARLGMSAPSVYRAKQKLLHEGLLPAATEAQVASVNT